LRHLKLSKHVFTNYLNRILLLSYPWSRQLSRAIQADPENLRKKIKWHPVYEM
jgi:hypothetical protein